MNKHLNLTSDIKHIIGRYNIKPSLICLHLRKVQLHLQLQIYDFDMSTHDKHNVKDYFKYIKQFQFHKWDWKTDQEWENTLELSFSEEYFLYYNDGGNWSYIKYEID
jgi:hypothetical protein